LVSEENFNVEEDIEKMILPKDLRVERDGGLVIIKPEEMRAEDRIVDIGPATIDMIRELSKKSKCILWNGPVGEYKEGYKETSLEIARAISESGAITITGGGDTLSAISEIKVEDKFTFVSTAGGAMLDFLADGTLPGIIALEEAQGKFKADF
jgi:phosphoglycerate kinase